MLLNTLQSTQQNLPSLEGQQAEVEKIFYKNSSSNKVDLTL